MSQLYGLGNVVSGAARAARNIKTDQRNDEIYEQGLEDAEYGHERQRITDERADEQYQLTKQDQEFNRGVLSATREFGITGDISKGLESYNSVNDGYEARAVDPRGKGGKYEIEFFDKASGESVGKKSFSKDEVGSMLIHMHDPMYKHKTEAAATQERLKHQNELELKEIGEAGATKREHIKGRYGLEKARLNTDGLSDGSNISKVQLKLDKERASFHRRAAEKNYSSSDGDMAGFSGKQDFVARNAHLATAYEAHGISDRNGSQRQALRDLRKYGKMAEERVSEELKSIDIGDSSEEDWIANRSRKVLETIVDNRLKQISSQQSQPVSPSVKQATASPQPHPAVVDDPTHDAGGLGLSSVDDVKTTLDMADTSESILAMVDGSNTKDNIPIDEGLSRSAEGVNDEIIDGLASVANGFKGGKADNSMSDLAGQAPTFSNDPGGVSAKKAYDKQVRNAAKMVKQRLRGKGSNLKGLTPELVKLALQDQSLIRILSKKTKAIFRQYLSNNVEVAEL